MCGLRAPCWKSAPRWPEPSSCLPRRCRRHYPCNLPTCPTYAANNRPDAPWRLPPQVPTTSCCWVRRAAARPCWPRACPASCPTPAKPKLWKPPPSPPSAAAASIHVAGGSAPTGHPTTPPARSPWSVAARIRVPVRFRWPTTVCCSWTNCRNGTGMRWKFCASRWSPARSRYRAPPAVSNSPHVSNWWRQ